MLSAVVANATSGVNVFAGSLELIVEARLSGDPWYHLSLAPDQIDTIEYAYLEGEEGLFTEERVGYEVDGLEDQGPHRLRRQGDRLARHVQEPRRGELIALDVPAEPLAFHPTSGRQRRPSSYSGAFPMQNYVQRGDVVTLPAPYDVLSGAGAQVGQLFGVAGCDALSGAGCRPQDHRRVRPAEGRLAGLDGRRAGLLGQHQQGVHHDRDQRTCSSAVPWSPSAAAPARSSAACWLNGIARASGA